MVNSWWQRGVVYQVYPRSFQDSNGDGVGDLRGILQRVDYLKWLGIDAVWISPIYPSPMADFGYDVSDYENIDPIFGTLSDFDELLTALHRAGLKLILDYVPNHTSIAHPWFKESRSSRTNVKRDWYIWRDSRPGGGPPTNWLSEFGGPAWSFDPTTEQYYYHAFLEQQPDLNWRNPEVQSAMHRVLRFWLERGVDGFRVDAIHMLMEDERYLDNPLNPAWLAGDSPAEQLLRTHTADLVEIHPHVADMRRVLNEYSDRVLIGEAYLPIERLMLYYGNALSGFDLPFNFHLISTAWNCREIANLVDYYEGSLPAGAWPNWVLGNHDRSRVRSRVGSLEEARLAAVLLLTLRGTPTLYNGDELGMLDGVILPDQIRDPWEKNTAGLGLGRDPCRTPMLWDSSPGAGFSSGEPWLPLSPHSDGSSVAEQSRDPRSMLSLYRELLALRRALEPLSIGSYRSLHISDELFVFERGLGNHRALVALNFSGREQTFEMPRGMAVVLSSHISLAAAESAGSMLRAYEGVIIASPST